MNLTNLRRASHGFGFVNPNLSKFIASSALTNFADGVRFVALPLLAASVTKNPVAVTLVLVFAYVPGMLFGVVIGSLIDFGKPRTFAAMASSLQAVAFSLLALLVLFGQPSVVLLCLFSLLLGCGEVVRDSAAQSMTPQISSQDQLERANSALLAAERIGGDLAGPSLGGVLFSMGHSAPFILNALLMLAGSVLTSMIQLSSPKDEASGPKVTAAEVYAASLVGVRWLWKSGIVRIVIFTGTGLTFCTLVWESVLVLVALGPLSLSAQWYGVIIAAGSVFGIVCTVAIPRLTERFGRRSLQMFVLVISGVSVLLLAAVPSPVTLALSWGCAGVTFSIWNVLSLTLRQRVVPSGMLARVNSANRSLSFTAVPLGALCGGLLSHGWGVIAPVWVAGSGLLVLASVFALSTRVPQAVTVDQS